MRFHEETFEVESRRRLEVVDITERVQGVIGRSGVTRGLVNLWVPHTTACLSVNEHDEELWEDLLAVMDRLVPLEGEYRHNAKYRWAPREMNAHAHILSTLIKQGVSLPIAEGRMRLGTWQSILLIELDGPCLLHISEPTRPY